MRQNDAVTEAVIPSRAVGVAIQKHESESDWRLLRVRSQ